MPLLATHTADRALNYQLRWVVTDTAGGVHTFPQLVHVVRQSVRQYVTAAEVARYAANAFPHYAQSMTGGHWREIARRAATRLESKLRATGRRPDLVMDSETLFDAITTAIKMELGIEGQYAPDAPIDTFMMDLDNELERHIEDATSLTWVDIDDSGTADATESAQRGTTLGVRS